MNILKMLKKVGKGGLFPVTCPDCRKKITNMSEATEHYNSCTAIQKQTAKVIKKQEEVNEAADR